MSTYRVLSCNHTRAGFYLPVLFLSVLLPLLFLLSGCRDGSMEEGESKRIFAVAVAEAAKEEIGKRLELSGELIPLRQVIVVPSMPGRVAEIRVAEGQRVREGQLLIRMENTQQELQLRQAEIAVKAGRVEVEKLAYLVEQGAVAEHLLRGARAELEQGEVVLELARYAYDVTFLKSPLPGVVGYIWAKEGELVGNTQVALVMDVDKVFVQLTVDEAQLPFLAESVPVTVEVPAVGGVPLQGRISSIGQVAVPGSRSFLVKVEVDNAGGELKPGMYARVAIEGESRNCVMVPGSALREEEGRAYVFVVARSRVRQRDVETGLRREGKVEIVQGLNPGERYVLRIPAGIQDGSTIEEIKEE